jgi:hypothetical protein
MTPPLRQVRVAGPRLASHAEAQPVTASFGELGNFGGFGELGPLLRVGSGG